MLANRLALVTGAGSGIGNAIASAFSKQGANVALVDLSKNLNDLAKEIEDKCEKKIKASGHVCDVSNSTQVNELFKEIKMKHPSQVPSIIVNSAGITRDAFLLKMNEKQFDEVVSVNLKGTFLVTQAAARALVEHLNTNPLDPSVKSYASIINLSSIVAKNGNLGQANYSASKAGVEGFTRTTAKELGKYKIRCNAILPGFIKTPMTDKVPAKVLEQMIRMVPLGRVGQPDDIAQLALFLASDASSYITGNSIECTGGVTF